MSCPVSVLCPSVNHQRRLRRVRRLDDSSCVSCRAGTAETEQPAELHLTIWALVFRIFYLASVKTQTVRGKNHV